MINRSKSSKFKKFKSKSNSNNNKWTCKVKEAIKKFEELICNLQDQAGTNDNNSDSSTDISSWNIDTMCLEDTCGTISDSLEDLIQAIIIKICSIETTNSSTGML